MPQRVFESLDALKQMVGQEVAVTDWFTMTQDRIQQFADATLDHQWIHVDVERAKRESPFKAPIAHGFLTLSLLAHFMEQAVSIRQKFSLAVNYGINKMRFVSPVKVGARIRARFVLAATRDVEPRGLEAQYNATIEVEGSEKPACVAEWLVRYYR
jgi:acyl dehydratase